MNQRNTLITGILFGGLAVGLGAFGAHALEAILEERGRTDTWDLAVEYQVIHALALLITGVLNKNQNKWLGLASTLLIAGVLCFSGSLYALCLTDIVFPIVLITPLGGVLLMAGWASLLVGVLKDKASL